MILQFPITAFLRLYQQLQSFSRFCKNEAADGLGGMLTCWQHPRSYWSKIAIVIVIVIVEDCVF